MSRHILPKRSGSHRIACKALYRALLSHVPHISLPAESLRGSINPIEYIIRNQFHRNQHVTSPRLAVAALKVGYEAEKLLRAAGDGDKISYSKVIQLLGDLQAQGNSDRARRATEPVTPPQPKPQKPAPYPGSVPLLESRPRPFSELSGIRHVPKLVNASGRPFLRIKKPQSLFLTRVLGDKVKQKQRRVEDIVRMEDEFKWTAYENEWSRILSKDVDGNEDDEPWGTAMADAIRESRRRINYEDQKVISLSREMLRIVDQERELAEQERQDRKRDKKQSSKEETGNL